ncbi:hypothetical protein CEXT_716111 [Caerostris extrusa]|uniref:Uncharacterized protein n=1 Tax=Caerostris extrusa TaxID=172846 RepID=A0AAV4Y3Z6_CAEEX|nr:hypothetical protein CEXT_716111 [Caerostris extrusa]
MLSLSHVWIRSPTAARLPLPPLSFKKPHSETKTSLCRISNTWLSESILDYASILKTECFKRCSAEYGMRPQKKRKKWRVNKVEKTDTSFWNNAASYSIFMMPSLSHGWIPSPTAARLPLWPLSFKKPHSETSLCRISNTWLSEW